jgi:hypothetical protein
VLLEDVLGEDEAEVLGRVSQHRDELAGIVDRELHAAVDGALPRVGERLIGREHVGEEERVKMPPFQQPGDVHPVVDAVVLQLPAARPGPHALVVVRGGEHVERVENHPRPRRHGH